MTVMLRISKKIVAGLLGARGVNRICNSNGISITETLVSLLLMMTLFGLTMGQFSQVAKGSLDHEIISQAEDQARTLLDMFAYDLRMIGNGLPLGQSDFPIVGGGLGDAPLAILLTSDVDYIEFRINESGKRSYLTEDYDPGVLDLNFEVLSTEDFKIGDQVYLSDMILGDNDGLRGEITNISGDEITIGPGFATVAGSIFEEGSMVTPVSTVIYDSPADWSGVTRDSGNGPVIMVPNSTFVLEYLDETGAAIGLPLSDVEVANDLTAIRLTVSVRSTQAVSTTDNLYTATATQIVALRNMVLNRN